MKSIYQKNTKIVFAIFIFLGIKFIKEAFEDKEGKNLCIDLKCLILLGIATSIDALAVGITFAFLEVNIILAVLIIGIIPMGILAGYGDIFYYNAPGIMRVDDIFGKYIELMESYQQPSREDLIQYLCEYLESAFEGNTYGSDPHKLEQSNIDLVADSVFNYMEMTNE